MTLDEWKDSDEWNMPLWKFLRCTHYYTERVAIYVVGGSRQAMEDKISSFYLTEDAFKGVFHNDYSEVERLLKYYADAPVWNICGEFTVDIRDHCDYNGKRISGRHVTACVTARVHYDDIRSGYLAEKADIKKAKRKEYAKKRKEQKADD